MKAKEQRIYLEGMAFAARVAKERGLSGLEEELAFRGANNAPLNVSRHELTAVARVRAKDELLFVATAMAATMVEDMRTPPSIVREFLAQFNARVERYRMDPGEFRQAFERMGRNVGLNEVCRSFLEEERENG